MPRTSAKVFSGCAMLLLALVSGLDAQSGVFDRAGLITGHGVYSSVPEETADLFTGNLMLRYRDIFLPGPNGLDVEVWRVYNSKVLGASSPGQGSVQAYPKSMLGVGWSMHMGILHQATSAAPVIEFPDGRRETAFLNNYSLGSNIYLTRDFLKLDKTAYKLYFQDGTVWTFSQTASLPLADGGSESVRLVTDIQDARGNAISIQYDVLDSYRSISQITDACGRQIAFHKNYGTSPAKLTSVTLKNYDGTHDATFSYSVAAFANGYYRLDSVTPPCLPTATFEYNNGASDHYELKKVTTSYGGVMEFTYGNQIFFMGSTQINSRVLTQKKITFNPGEQAKVWDFTYPSYQGATTGTTTVDGPEYDTSVTHYGYDSQNTWRIALMTTRTVSDASHSMSYSWTYQQVSNTSWSVMGINMGPVKGPLLASAINSAQGDSTVSLDLTYRTTPTQSPKRYGQRTITKYWDGMGRDLGYMENGDGTTLYYLRTLDAEGRATEANQGSTSPAHKYSCQFDAAGRPTQITDPVNKTTIITYTGTNRTIADPMTHATIFAYNDLPGSPTTVTDAQNRSAVYTYDAVGRLVTVLYNGARQQSYAYDGVDNVTSESHPETGEIQYHYNTENRCDQKTWGGATLSYFYDTSGRLRTITGAEQTWYTFDSKGRAYLVAGSSGWSRQLDYNIWGSVTSERQTIPSLGSKTVSYAYDENNILKQVTYPDGRVANITNNGLNMPESLSFNSKTLVSNAAYGPNRQLTGATIAGNGTSMTATYYYNGALSTASLMHGATALYNASYSYDGAGNISGIASTAPTLSATFGYDSLNRLTSASYTSGPSHTYDYDEYGNMKTVTGGSAPFNKQYDSSNRIMGFSYDDRGNLTSADGKNYYWDIQNRLIQISDVAGQILGEYRYDDRGLRLFALPPLPDIAVDGLPSGSDIEMTSHVNESTYRTLTIRNLGHANLIIGQTTIGGTGAGHFSVHQQPDSLVVPNGSTTLVVEFLPISPGNKTATLSIPSNDPFEPLYTINLIGYCEPQMTVLEVAQGGLYDFGTVYKGDYIEATFTVKNAGSGTLLLYGAPVVISGSGMGSFSVSQQAASPLDPNATSMFRIMFAPNSQGLKTATVSIQSNDSDRSPFTFTITGTGDIGPQKVTDEEELALTSPLGGEKWASGSIQNITWTGGKNAKAIKIEYSPDNGSTYLPVIERADNVGVYSWKVPANISSACLVRVSDADGPPAAPLIIAYEFNFKVSSLSSDRASGQESLHFTFRAGVPDKTASVYRVADVSFGPGSIPGAENLLFNEALAEMPAEDSFLGAWHHACVHYDLRDYSGSVWIDGGSVMSGVPLVTKTLEPESPGEVTLSKGRDPSVSLWIDDIEVGFLDLRDAPSRHEQNAFGLLFRDRFSTYESPSLLAQGGWKASSVNVPAEALRTGSGDQVKGTAEGSPARGDGASGFRALIDERQFATNPRAMRLEPEVDEPISGLAKRVSFPVRVPFAVSGDSFSIVGDAVESAEAPLTRGMLEGGKNDDRGSPVALRSQRLAPESHDRMDLSAPAGKSVAHGTSTNGGTAKMMSVSPAGGSFYIYCFDGRLLAEYNLCGECVRDYIYMGAQLVAEYQPSTSQYYYYMSDQINSTRVVTDDTGAVVYSAAYDPYGGVQQTWVNTFDPALKFSGKERDGESGLDYFGARYYDRSQYRFISPDQAANGARHPWNQEAWNYYSYWAHFKYGGVNKDGIIPLIDQALWSVGQVDRQRKPSAHVYSSKELYPTPNLANQSGDPNKPGLAYQMDLDNRYQSKPKEFELKLTVLNWLFGYNFDVTRESRQLRWLYFAWNDIVRAPNDVVFLSGMSGYRETNPFIDLTFYTLSDFPDPDKI